MRRGVINGPVFGLCCLLAQAAWGQDGAAVSPKEPPAAGGEEIGEEIEEVGEVRVLPAGGGSNPADFPALDRVANLLTPATARRGTLLLTIDHRPYERLTHETFRDFFGFDAGNLKVGLGLRLGLLDDLDVGLARLNGTGEIFDVYQLDLRYRLLEQSRAWLDVAVRAGISWFYQPSVDDASGYLGELLLARTLFGRLSLGTGLVFHSSSSGADKSNQDDGPSLAVAAWAEVRLFAAVRWSLELSAPVAGYAEAYPAMTTALKLLTNRHAFSLLVSNTQYTTADGLAAGSGRDLGELIFGFTILREFDP